MGRAWTPQKASASGALLPPSALIGCLGWEEKASCWTPERLLETLAFAEHRLLYMDSFVDFSGRVTRLFLAELLRRLGLPAAVGGGVTERTVQRDLEILRALGLVQLTGRGRGARYSLGSEE